MPLDLRVQKTQANIEEQFLALLKTHAFQDITVKMLILECRINRSTFYRNYEDKYDLLGRIARKVLEKFSKAIRPGFIVLPELDEQRLRPCFVPLLDFFEEARPVLSTLKASELPIDIFGDMHTIFSDGLLLELKNHYRLDNSALREASYFSRIISSNILTAIEWWHEESPQSSQEDVLRLITSTVTKGIYHSMEKHFSRF